MKAIVTCIRGIEQITINEIKQKLNIKAEILIPTKIIFNINNYKQLANFTYESRSITDSYLLLKQFKFKTKQDIIKENITIPFNKETFAIKCNRQGEHNFSSKDIEIEYADNINLKANLTNPDINIIIDIIDNLCLIGIDFSGIKLNKRDYRVKTNPFTINATINYAALQLSDYKETDFLIDPMCKDGTNIIEAALITTNTPNCYFTKDKLAFNRLIDYEPKTEIKELQPKIFGIDNLLNNIRSTEINAKLAKVNKLIKLSKNELSWLDIKFDKQSVDKIITIIPSRESNLILKELFHQANYILKENSKITLISKNKIKKHENFKIIKEHKIQQKTSSILITVLVKDTISKATD